MMTDLIRRSLELNYNIQALREDDRSLGNEPTLRHAIENQLANYVGEFRDQRQPSPEVFKYDQLFCNFLRYFGKLITF